MKQYAKKHERYIKSMRIFKDSKIATLDRETDKRTKMVANLLGNSREAVEIT